MKHHDLDFLQSELTRVSEWVQFADKKAGFVAAFYSAILGLLITKRNDLFWNVFAYHRIHCEYALLVIALLIVLGIGLYYLFITVVPQLKNNNASESLFYFGTVAAMNAKSYKDAIEQLTEEDARRQVAEQIHANSVIADAKMTSIRKSTYALMATGVLAFLLFFL